jgi:DNA repair protein RecN (Recombination protein N)
MIFDEVDQGVGGAVADAVGLRLRGWPASAQVLVVTHSPQVAARAHAHWRISKSGDETRIRTAWRPCPPPTARKRSRACWPGRRSPTRRGRRRGL